MRLAIRGNTVDAKATKLRVATLNVGSLRGRSGEVVEMLTRRSIDICCAQETRWRGESARLITGKDSRYKCFWKGEKDGFGGVGILVAERWIEKVLSISRVSDRIIWIRLLNEKGTINVFSVYAPQARRPQEEMDSFYQSLLSDLTAVPDEEVLVVGGDFNGHVGQLSDGFDGVHGNRGIGSRNAEGISLLDLCVALDLAVVNTFFEKAASRLITYKSGSASTQIDYMLVRRSDLRLVRDSKVIGSEECISQHKLLISDFNIVKGAQLKKILAPRLRIWKLKSADNGVAFERDAAESFQSVGQCNDVGGLWSVLKSGLTGACERTCGYTKGGPVKRKETWWWNDAVDAAVKLKRKLWKEWQSGGSKDLYLEAKRATKSAIYYAKKSAQQAQFNDLNLANKRNQVFRLARKMKAESEDVVGEKCVKGDDGRVASSVADKLAAWKNHYGDLLNVEFPWDPDVLSPVLPTLGPPPWIGEAAVKEAVSAMKERKAAGPSGIVVEMIRAGGDAAAALIAKLANACIREGRIPTDWNLSYIISLYKGKGDALERGNYRGLKLQDQVLKVIERVLEPRIREQVAVDSMQFGFMPGRGTSDAIFILRQLQEKYIGKRKDLYFVFVDLETALIVCQGKFCGGQ